MTTIVTGATGHVGANLVRALLAQGRRVRVLVRRDDPASLRGLDIERVRGDVRDARSLRHAFDGCEVLYHAAARISIVGGDGGLVRAVNVDGVRNAVVAALDAGIRRMIHFSSVHAFRQDPLDLPVDESRERVVSRRAPAYDLSKAAGEAEVRRAVAERGLDAVVVHPSGVVGPFDFEPSRMGRVFLDLYYRRMPALIDGGFDWVDVRDVVQGAIAAEERGRRNESYILSGRWLSIRDLARVVAELTGIRAPVFTTPMGLARIAAPFAELGAKVLRREPLFTTESLAALRCNRVYLHDKAARELDHAPRSFESSVRDIYGWFSANGHAQLAGANG